MMKREIHDDRSSRHSKISGNFGENTILYLLSKSGFECALIDHTGIDILARNPHTNELIGISVKSRSRVVQKRYAVGIKNDDLEKADAACKSFGCKTYFAIVVDESDKIYCFLTSKDHLLKLFPNKKQGSLWKMSDNWLEKYRKDPAINMVQFSQETIRWWGKKGFV
jgi:hypothetical protein